MKRKASISQSTYPLPVLEASPLRVLHAVQGSEFQLPSSTSQANNDGSGRKRVKFRDLHHDRLLTCRQDTSPVPLKNTQVAKSNDAKTSEFAFFKKLKEEASFRFNSSPLGQKKHQSKKFKSSESYRERASPSRNCFEDFTSNFLAENVTPVNFEPLHSPLGKSSQSLGSLRSHSDIFNRKRQKLRQFIQNIYSLGSGESYEKGYGFVSMLLSRLIPENHQNRSEYGFENQKQLPARCLPRLDYGLYFDNNLSPSQLNKSGKVLPYSEFSTNSGDGNFYLEYRTEKLDYELEEKVTSLNVNDSSSSPTVEKYRSLMSSKVKRFKPLDGLSDQNEHLLLRKQEPKALLLGWDIDNSKDGNFFSSQLIELNTIAIPPTSFASVQANLGECFGAVELCQSPLPWSNSRNFYSLPFSSLASYQIHGSSRYDVEKKEDIAAACFNNADLNISCVPKCPSLCDSSVDHKGGSGNSKSDNFFSSQSGHWFMNNVFGNRYPCIRSLYGSSLLFDVGWEYVSGSREHCEAGYRTLEFPLNEARPEVTTNEECILESSESDNGCPSLFVQPESFLWKEKVCHFLTDKSS